MARYVQYLIKKLKKEKHFFEKQISGGRLVSLDVKTKFFLCALFSVLEREKYH